MNMWERPLRTYRQILSADNGEVLFHGDCPEAHAVSMAFGCVIGKLTKYLRGAWFNKL